jgi:hypothetical protein
VVRVRSGGAAECARRDDDVQIETAPVANLPNEFVVSTATEVLILLYLLQLLLRPSYFYNDWPLVLVGATGRDRRFDRR